MVLYNLTNVTSATGAGSLVVAANQLTGGVLLGLLTLALFIIMLLGFKRYGFVEALLAAGFINFIIAGIMTTAGFIQIIFPLLYLAITAFTGLYMYMTNR